MNQPHMAPWWFPANDHPRDKALVDISHHGAARAARSSPTAGGWRTSVDGNQATYHWRADEPMVPYLAFFAAGRFRVVQGRPRRRCRGSSRSRARLPASQQRTSMRLMQKTPGVVAWLASQLGDYPFSQTGGLTTEPEPRLRAGEPDPPDLPGARLQRRRAPSCTSWRTSGSATRSRSRAGATSGSTRVPPPSWRCATTRRTAAQDAQAWLESSWSSFGAEDPFWHLVVSRPGAAQHLRLAGLPARGDDAAGAAPPGG